MDDGRRGRRRVGLDEKRRQAGQEGYSEKPGAEGTLELIILQYGSTARTHTLHTTTLTMSNTN